MLKYLYKLGGNMQNYNISLNDINANYFHFTLKDNFKSIEKEELIPQKGKHAEHI